MTGKISITNAVLEIVVCSTKNLTIINCVKFQNHPIKFCMVITKLFHIIFCNLCFCQLKFSCFITKCVGLHLFLEHTVVSVSWCRFVLSNSFHVYWNKLCFMQSCQFATLLCGYWFVIQCFGCKLGLLSMTAWCFYGVLQCNIEL